MILLQSFKTGIGCSIDCNCALEVWWGYSPFTYPAFLQTQWSTDFKKWTPFNTGFFRCSFSTTMPSKKMKAFFLSKKFSHISKCSKFKYFLFFCWKYRTKNDFASKDRTRGNKLSNAREWLILPMNFCSLLTVKSFKPSVFLYKSNFCVVNIHLPTKLQNWKSAEYRRCPSWYISRYMSTPIHWFPKKVVTFLKKSLRRVQTGSRPSIHHSEVRSSLHLCSTKDVAFHTCRGFFTYSATSRVFLCFFCENYHHHFSFLQFLENRSNKKFLLGFNEDSPESWQ